jgi:uncharacterized protein (DUF488 family)
MKGSHAKSILTVGHSTRSLEEFLSLLHEAGVRTLVDVRRYPGSRRHPHFGGERLAGSLRAAGIEYVWLPGVGGRRSPKKNSPHTGWRVEAFAGYADHMDSAEFREAAGELLRLAQRGYTAIMCAEALPHRCHRRLLSDWLTVHGVAVTHVLASRRLEPHEMTPFARVVGDRILYDRGQAELFQSEL